MNNKFKLIINKFFAFTLAEVLVVIGIIGVVAALTIPTLIQNSQEKALLTEFQETYSILQQVYIQVAQDNGTGDKWTDTTAMYNMLKPYFKLIKECPDADCDATANFYTSLSGVNGAGGSYRYHFMLANGAVIFIGPADGTWPAGLQVDINGKKGPNKVGYDFFGLDFSKKNNLPFLSWPFYTSDGSSFVEDGSDTCNKTSTLTDFWNGGGCSYWIIRNGNMDYMHRNISDAEWTK